MKPIQTAQKILKWFGDAYIPKFLNGQKEHGGDITQMGAYQALRNAKDEMHDFVSYIYLLEQCLDEIRDVIAGKPDGHLVMELKLKAIEAILNRLKEDGGQDGRQ